MKPFTALILMLINALFLSAQGVNFTATASKTKIVVGEQIQIDFSVNAAASNFHAPSFDGFSVYMGPSTSSSVQIINGQYSQSLTLSYIIAPTREGALTIGPATIKADGKTLQSNPIKIEVVKGSQQNSNNAGRSGGNRSNADREPEPSNTMFVRTILSKTKALQGEQLLVTHKVYSKARVMGFRDIEFPPYEGFWSQVIQEHNHNIQLQVESFEGENYYVAVLRQAILFPQRTGTIEIKPMSVDMIVRQKGPSDPNDIFEQFFGSTSFKDVQYKIKSNTVKLEVLPLPENNKPANFNGNVGSYTISAKVDKDQVKANQAVTITVQISGKGNLKMIEPPKLTLSDAVEAYDPKTIENINVTANGLSGSKTFEYVIIPRKQGKCTVGMEPLSFYDTDKKHYVILNAPEFNITVTKGDKEDAAVMVDQSNNKTDVKELGNDIRFIKTTLADLHQINNAYFYRSGLFYILLLLPLIATLSFVVWYKRNQSANKNLPLLKEKKASKIAQKRLAIAQTHLTNNNKELFYEEVHRAINGYIGDKLTIALADLSRDKIINTLDKHNLPRTITDKLIEIIDKCEFARYAPLGGQVEMGNLYKDAISTIVEIEGKV